MQNLGSVRPSSSKRAASPVLPQPVAGPIEPNHRTIELISKFCLSQGIPFSFAEEPFHDFANYLNSDLVLPKADDVAQYIEKMTAKPKPIDNFQEPISVTFDVAESGEENYLVFSIHHFEKDPFERKNKVFLRKMFCNKLSADNILKVIRHAIDHKSITNLVCPDLKVSKLFDENQAIKRTSTCFYSYMNMFVTDLLNIKEFAEGLSQLRGFIRFIKSRSDMLGKYRRMKMSQNMELDPPRLDDEQWCNTLIFLTKCLAQHDFLIDFCERHNSPEDYISNETFNHLIYLQRVLYEAVKRCDEMSNSTSSISQNIPAISGLHNVITANSRGYPFQKKIRDFLLTSFGEITNGPQRKRFELATFLDPRYVYSGRIFNCQYWVNLEKEIIDLDSKSFKMDQGTTDEAQRRDSLTQELTIYRRESFVARPEKFEDPFDWWSAREMPILANMAREYLACPAVTVDAGYFFANAGKFEHIAHMYSKLNSVVEGAGPLQEFRGKGDCDFRITIEMMEALEENVRKFEIPVNF